MAGGGLKTAPRNGHGRFPPTWMELPRERRVWKEVSSEGAGSGGAPSQGLEDNPCLSLISCPPALLTSCCRQGIHLSTIHLSLHHLASHPATCPHIHPPIRPSVRPSAHPYTHLPTHTSIHPPIHSSLIIHPPLSTRLYLIHPVALPLLFFEHLLRARRALFQASGVT